MLGKKILQETGSNVYVNPENGGSMAVGRPSLKLIINFAGQCPESLVCCPLTGPRGSGWRTPQALLETLCWDGKDLAWRSWHRHNPTWFKVLKDSAIHRHCCKQHLTYTASSILKLVSSACAAAWKLKQVPCISGGTQIKYNENSLQK